MKILSIYWGECSTAALLVDGQIVACQSEERFSRIKNDERYPQRAIEAVLEFGNVNAADLDCVVFAGERFDIKAVLVHKYSGFSISDRLREQKDYFFPRMYERKNPFYGDVFKDKLDINQPYFSPETVRQILHILREGDVDKEVESLKRFRKDVVRSHLGVPSEKVCFAEHHRAHACYAYYGSPLRTRGNEKTLILTADAFGDNCNATIWVVDPDGFRLISRSSNFQGARLYRSMTLLLGMKPDEHEYKVMGLAAYAKPEYYQKAYEVFRNTQYVDGLGFAYSEQPPDLYVYFRDRLEGLRFDTIAGGLQKYTEEILVQWSRNALAASGVDRLVFGGGIAMNVKAMMEIAKLPELREIFVCPSPSDESLAIGAAYLVMHDALVSEGRDPDSYLQPMPNAYLGVESSLEEAKRVAAGFQGDPTYRVREGVDLPYVASRLAEGKIVGRCFGRNEFGARALGNRSILADPRQLVAIRRINESVKNRDFWMPFAPTVLADRADDYLLRRNGGPAPYMTVAFETKPLARRELVAGLHQADFTCRPQILEHVHNPAYFDLIKEFERQTEVGSVLNTSFNLHGEPIVQTPSDAARVFRLSGLDLLLLDGYLIEKV